MPVAMLNQHVCIVRLFLSPDEVQELLCRHAAKYPHARAREQQGATVIEADFQPSDTKAFVREVVIWGKGHRFLDRLFNQNTPNELSTALREANNLLNSGHCAAAVSQLQTLQYLGQSFASKIARFLTPERAIILDETIRTALGYCESQAGYQEFLDDCQTVLGYLAPIHPQLRICDVEAAIFAKIKGY